MKNEIERLFISDIREKKRIGSGVYHRTGKGVKHQISGIKFPSDFLTLKERKELNGKVVVYNMYDKILTQDEFDTLDEETQKNMLTYWRKNYTIKQIQKEIGVASATFYKYIGRLGLPKNYRNSKKRKRSQNKQELALTQESAMVPAAIPVIQPTKLITKGLYLEYNGVYSAEKIGKILEKLQLILSDEENNFNISISISEIID